jgi:hypothetical protein
MFTFDYGTGNANSTVRDIYVYSVFIICMMFVFFKRNILHDLILRLKHRFNIVSTFYLYDIDTDVTNRRGDMKNDIYNDPFNHDSGVINERELLHVLKKNNKYTALLVLNIVLLLVYTGKIEFIPFLVPWILS